LDLEGQLSSSEEYIGATSLVEHSPLLSITKTTHVITPSDHGATMAQYQSRYGYVSVIDTIEVDTTIFGWGDT